MNHLNDDTNNLQVQVFSVEDSWRVWVWGLGTAEENVGTALLEVIASTDDEKHVQGKRDAEEHVPVQEQVQVFICERMQNI